MVELQPSLGLARGDVFTPVDARAAGCSTAEIRANLAAGRWVALRRGVYTTRRVRDRAFAEPYSRHRLLTAAALAAVERPSVASHVSAAVVHGLALVDPPDDGVHLTTDEGSSHQGPGLSMHCAELGESETTTVAHLPVTAVPRTLFDLGRRLSFADAVASIDQALHTETVTAEQLRDTTFLHEAWPGSGTARRAISFADGRSESIGESLGRVAIASAGLPAPQLQVELHDEQGLIGRTDFLFAEARVVGEFDGRLKYLTPADLYHEKRREDRIRRLNYGVLRFDWTVARFRPRELLGLFRDAAATVDHRRLARPA